MASRKELTNGKYIDDQMGNGIPEGGTTGQVLKKSSNADYDVEWETVVQNVTGGGGTGSVNGSGVATRVAFWSASDTLSSSANLYWDSTNNRLGIGTTTPSKALDVTSDAKINSALIGIGPNSGSSFPNTNLVFGNTALNANTTGYYNLALGTNALSVNTTGYANVAIGYDALKLNVITRTNVAIGWAALQNFVGDGTVNGGNLAIGAIALQALTTGKYNTAIGYASNYQNTTGIYNTSIGYTTMRFVTSGDYNTVIGNIAGSYYGTAGTAQVTSMNYNTLIGYYARNLANASTNEIVIGSFALGNGSNTTTIGTSSTTSTNLFGSLGFGTTPNYGTSGQVLTSNGSGLAPTWTTVSGGLFSADIVVSLSGGKTLGRYTTGQTIPSNGKTAQEVVTLLAQEALAPTVTLTSSTTIAFNQTAISNVLNFTKTINSLGASVSTVSLEWRRNNTGSWTVLSTNTALTTFTHSLTDSAFNTQPFNYRYIVTDTAGGTATATLNITPASYVAPTITFSAPATGGVTSPETNTNRELGNTQSTLQGSCSRNSVNVPISAYQFSVSINGAGYTNIGTSVGLGSTGGAFTNVTNLPNTSTTTSIIYRVQVTDSYQTTTATYSISLSSILFYGEINVATTINSAAIRALSRKFANDGVNPFTFASGTTNRRWLVAMIDTYSLTNAQDITQNVDLTSSFASSTTSVNDFAGNARTYNLYNYTNAVAYTSSVNIRITYT